MTTDRLKVFSSALYVGIVGDALGVPVATSTREELALCAVKNMLGYGRFDQPEGTWSDDTSLILCTMESLQRGYDLEDMGATFCKWLFESYWTPRGFVFDVGLTTFMALDNLRSSSTSAKISGCKTEDDNGNGSLMRILPAALFFHSRPVDEFLGIIHDISGITHVHPRAKMGCGIYSLLIRQLISSDDKEKSYHAAVTEALEFYSQHEEFKNELPYYLRILSYQIPKLDESEIQSSGYVVDTLEASIWCFFQYATTKEIVLAAVNLGLSTDTNGMVAGALGGLFYGLDSIPPEWFESLARKPEIDQLVSTFVKSIP